MPGQDRRRKTKEICWKKTERSLGERERERERERKRESMSMSEYGQCVRWSVKMECMRRGG